MKNQLLLELAASGHSVPIGTHLVLHKHADHEAILTDGPKLGAVVAETAERFSSPLAIPLMDLKIEKEALLSAMGIPAEKIDGHHFEEVPPRVEEVPATVRMKATCECISTVAADHPSLVPMGMCIGPFSLMTKLVSDPITPVYLVGEGTTADEDEDVAIVERCLETGLDLILRYIASQIDAGAKAMIVCEPAANQVYFSPNQLAESFGVFDRFVMEGLGRIKALLEERGVDFVLHDCGELTDEMVARFGGLEPAMLSLGGSRVLWEDARLLPKSTVLYGNLPSKRFYAADLTTAMVESMARDMVHRMRDAAHPFILGSECDVLSVPGSEQEIESKVEAFLKASAA
jgi:uroporphyrinogen-III decarboxylase